MLYEQAGSMEGPVPTYVKYLCKSAKVKGKRPRSVEPEFRGGGLLGRGAVGWVGASCDGRVAGGPHQTWTQAAATNMVEIY